MNKPRPFRNVTNKNEKNYLLDYGPERKILFNLVMSIKVLKKDTVQFFVYNSIMNKCATYSQKYNKFPVDQEILSIMKDMADELVKSMEHMTLQDPRKVPIQAKLDLLNHELSKHTFEYIPVDITMIREPQLDV